MEAGMEAARHLWGEAQEAFLLGVGGDHYSLCLQQPVYHLYLCSAGTRLLKPSEPASGSGRLELFCCSFC
jgi:hypothetical protein